MNTFNLAGLLAHPRNGGLSALDPQQAAVQDPWRDVMLVIEEAQLPNSGPGSMAVLASGAPAAAWQQDALIRRVADRGYRALALPGAAELSSGTRELAARIGLILLDVADPVALARAGWELVEGRDALSLAYVRRVAQSIQYHAESLPDLLGHLASRLGHGVALVDREGVLEAAGSPPPPAVRAAIDFETWSCTVNTPEGCAAAVTLDSPGRRSQRLVIGGPVLAPQQLAALSVAAEVAMPAVAARVLIDEVAEVNDVALASGLLRDLLEQTDGPDPDLLQRMAERGWLMNGYHLGFHIICRGRIQAIQLLRLVRQELARLPGSFHATTSGRGVTGWFSFTQQPTRKALETRIADLHALHNRLRRSLNVATGVGALGGGTHGLVSTVESAMDAARMASSRSATGYFLRIDTLGLEQRLLSWAESDTFVPAARELLDPLLGNTPELLTTLTAYLDQESSTTATAQELDLHRNTVTARLARIQELLGLDLTDPETRLAVQLACRAVRP